MVFWQTATRSPSTVLTFARRVKCGKKMCAKKWHFLRIAKLLCAEKACFVHIAGLGLRHSRLNRDWASGIPVSNGIKAPPFPRWEGLCSPWRAAHSHFRSPRGPFQEQPDVLAHIFFYSLFRLCKQACNAA